MFQNRIIALLSTCSLLASCAGGGAGPLGLGAVFGDRNLAAAEPLFSKDEERCLNRADQLLALIYNVELSDVVANSNCGNIRTTFRYIITHDEEYRQYNTQDRNEIIDALMASSNRKCTRYVALLKNADGAINSALSLGAIISGGLGSFVGGPSSAKALAGTAGILSGSRAAINETYLSNQTIHVLAAAFEKARRDQRRIITNRQQCSTDEYTLMRGIEDALAYHNSCSLVAGLAETARSIERSENPGVETMRQTFAEFANLNRQVAEFGATGPITPLAPAPTPASLEKLQAADALLTEKGNVLTDMEMLESTASVNLAAGQAMPVSESTPEQVASLKIAFDQAHLATIKAKIERDEAGKARNREVMALVRATTAPEQITQTETRACPFRGTS